MGQEKQDSRDWAATIILWWIPGDVHAVGLDLIIVEGSFWGSWAVKHDYIEGAFIFTAVVLQADLVWARVCSGGVDGVEDTVVVDGSDGGAHISQQLFVVIVPEYAGLWLANVVHIHVQHLAGLDADVVQRPQDLGLHCGCQHVHHFQFLCVR